MSWFHKDAPKPEPVDIDIIVIQENDSEEIRLLKHILRELRAIHREIRQRSTPSRITFKEVTMLPPVAGNTLVYTGTLSPAGAQFPADAVFALQSSDPTVQPTVDATGLVVTIPLPQGFVDDPNNPFSVGYAATSPSNPGWTVTATITPSVPPVLPTGITFVQTT